MIADTSVFENVLPLGIFDDPKFAKLAVENSQKYRSADPFPHIFFDGFLDEKLAIAIENAFPMPDQIGWIERDNANNKRRYQHDETKLPSLIRQMLRELNSRQFLLFLETLTGIDNLLPDPYFIGGGAHMSGAGEFLKIHADFNWHHKLQAHRRVNVLLYLTRDWREEWGGHLELWDKGMARKVVSVSPIFNRLMIFSTSEDSNHGQPHPNACPPNVYRKVLNLYYYTSRRDESEIAAPHFTLYKTEASPFAMELAKEYRDSAGGTEHSSE
jgi:hypothetical protein